MLFLLERYLQLRGVPILFERSSDAPHSCLSAQSEQSWHVSPIDKRWRFDVRSASRSFRHMACSCRSSIAVVCSDMLSAVPAAPSLPPPAPLPVFGPVPAPAGALRDAVVSDSFFQQLRSPAVVRGRRGQYRFCFCISDFFFVRRPGSFCKRLGHRNLSLSTRSRRCHRFVARRSFRWDGCGASAIKSIGSAIMCCERSVPMIE